jgi:spermidine synthase
MRRSWLYGLFFLSGMSALIYELIWQRQLHLIFGVSTLAISSVLAAFMGGLALGGLLFGRRADRTARPLRFYAFLEAGIAATALLVPAGFGELTRTYTALYSWLQPGPWGGSMIRLGLGLMVLIVPATLIGGTLPVMARLSVRRADRLPATFSLLYAVNTLGAVLGAVLTGFVFLRYLGMADTLWIAVGLNAAVAVVAVLLSGGEEQSFAASNPVSAPATQEATTGRWWFALAAACAGATGATTLGLEVVWSRILGIFTSNSAYAFALVLSVLLFGMALGSLVQWLWSRRPGDSWRRLAVCQWLLAAGTLAVLPCLRSAPAWLDRLCDGQSVWMMFLGELALTAAVLLAPAVLIGMSFPLLAAGVASDPRRFGTWLGRVYAVNTLGCIAGAFLAGFVFIPWVGLQATLGIFVAVTVAVGLIAWSCAARPRPAVRVMVGIVMVGTAALVWHRLPAGEFHKSPSDAGIDILYYQEGNNGTVSVMQEPTGRRWLLVDGQPVAGTGRTIVIDQKMLAHLPLLLHPEPRRALTVGFGSGGTSYSMTLHDIDVDCVEIERAVPAAAEHFASENHDVLANPRFHLIVDDARSWLRVAPVNYDVICTDCTNIQYKSNADLYTVEYFRLMKQRLAENGLAAAWVPANGIAPDDLRTLLRSFQAVFPHTSIWFINTLATDFLIVIGTPAELDIDLDRLRERMAAPAVRQDLEVVGLAEPCRLLYTELTADDDLTRYLDSGPLNTDDRPLLAYTTYGASFRSTIAANLAGLLAVRNDVGNHVEHTHSITTMLRHYVASNEAVMGHVAAQAGNETEALTHYLRGAQMLPTDPSLRELVVTSYFRTHAEVPSE